MQKSEARKFYKAKRRLITPQQKLKWDDLLLIQFQKLELPFISSVLSFYPIESNNEVNTFIITDYLSFINPGLNIAYPRSDLINHSMQAVRVVDDAEFKENFYNIPEPISDMVLSPKELDVVLVPLLVCDQIGQRVGYGKGFYDRYLKQCRIDCLKIGLCYFEPIDQIDDASEFDVPLNICITPEQVYVF